MQSLPTVQTLIGEALEVCIHQILYQRRLYPRDFFVPTRDYLGILCHVTTHVELASYIVQTLDVAVPALCCGMADKLAVVIMDNSSSVLEESEMEENAHGNFPQQFSSPRRPSTPKIIESYTFEVDSLLLEPSQNSNQNQNRDWTPERAALLERRLKNLVMKIITMDHTFSRHFERSTFRLQLHAASHSPLSPENGCKDFHHAVLEGLWYEIEDAENSAPSHLEIAGVKCELVPECNLRVKLVVKVSKR